MDDGRLGFGVVGINQRVRRSILAGFGRSRFARLAAVCSRDLEKARQTAEEFGGTPYASFPAMLADPAVEVVFICTPHSLHCPMSLAALSAGKHVVCEKPLALTLAEAEEMVAAAERAGVRTAVNFTYHSLPGHRLIAREITAGTIGTVVHVSLTYWQARQRLPGATPGDALLDIGSHLVDLATWWTAVGGAGEIRAIVSQEGGRDEAPPIWAALARTDRGALVTFQANRVAAGWRNGMECSVVGTDGMLSLVFDTDTAEVRCARFGSGRPEGILSTVPIPADLWVSYHDFPPFHLDRIVRGLRGEEEFPDFRYGLRCQRILDAAQRSGRNRQWIEIPG